MGPIRKLQSQLSVVYTTPGPGNTVNFNEVKIRKYTYKLSAAKAGEKATINSESFKIQIFQFCLIKFQKSNLVH